MRNTLDGVGGRIGRTTRRNGLECSHCQNFWCLDRIILVFPSVRGDGPSDVTFALPRDRSPAQGRDRALNDRPFDSPVAKPEKARGEKRKGRDRYRLGPISYRMLGMHVPVP